MYSRTFQDKSFNQGYPPNRETSLQTPELVKEKTYLLLISI